MAKRLGRNRRRRRKLMGRLGRKRRIDRGRPLARRRGTRRRGPSQKRYFMGSTSFSGVLGEQARRNEINRQRLASASLFSPASLLPNAFVEDAKQRQRAFVGRQTRDFIGAAGSAIGSGGGPFQRLSRFSRIRSAQRSLP